MPETHDPTSVFRACSGGRILGVGIATLDLINEVETYPGEDTEVRALAQRRARGGNVTNSLAVHIPEATTPTSYIALSRATGSRTIVHFRDLHELDAAAFERHPLTGF